MSNPLFADPIRRSCRFVAFAGVALTVLACSPAATRHDASSARADQARADRQEATTQVRRKADMERVASRARDAAADDIARSDAYQAARAAERAAGE